MPKPSSNAARMQSTISFSHLVCTFHKVQAEAGAMGEKSKTKVYTRLSNSVKQDVQSSPRSVSGRRQSMGIQGTPTRQ